MFPAPLSSLATTSQYFHHYVMVFTHAQSLKSYKFFKDSSLLASSNVPLSNITAYDFFNGIYLTKGALFSSSASSSINLLYGRVHA